MDTAKILRLCADIEKSLPNLCLTIFYRERDELIEKLKVIAAEVSKQPEIKPEVRHGRWKKKNGEIYCTNCKKSKWSESFELMLRRFNFCPNCGADMREVSEDADK